MQSFPVFSILETGTASRTLRISRASPLLPSPGWGPGRTVPLAWLNSVFSTTVTACDADAVFQAPYVSSFSLSYSCPVSASCPSPEQLPTKPPARWRSPQDALSQPPASCITTISPKLMQGHGNASWTGTSNRKSPSNCFSRGHRRKGCAGILHGLTRQGQSTGFQRKNIQSSFPSQLLSCNATITATAATSDWSLCSTGQASKSHRRKYQECGQSPGCCPGAGTGPVLSLSLFPSISSREGLGELGFEHSTWRARVGEMHWGLPNLFRSSAYLKWKIWEDHTVQSPLCAKERQLKRRDQREEGAFFASTMPLCAVYKHTWHWKAFAKQSSSMNTSFLLSSSRLGSAHFVNIFSYFN